MQHCIGDLESQDSQLEEESWWDKKLLTLPYLVKLCELRPPDMRAILYTWTDEAPVQSKQLGGREKWTQTA